jgi:hypothetical protein
MEVGRSAVGGRLPSFLPPADGETDESTTWRKAAESAREADTRRQGQVSRDEDGIQEQIDG